MIKLNFDVDGYVANWTRPPGDVENSIEFYGELPPDFTANCRCYRLVDDVLVFDPNRQAAMQLAEAAQQEIAEIEAWFAWYDNQVMQYSRAQRLGDPFDREIAELDVQAKQNQLRLREIRDLVD